MNKLFVLLLLLLAQAKNGLSWDSEELDVFDVVEEINQNFYEFMGITEGADTSDVKKAYRTLSKQLHPDKNDAADAEIMFRQLVSVYEILKDENRRAIYNRVLVEGLPSWRDPIYYYRRARKFSLIEISVILTVLISITQYLMSWGSYIDKRHTMEEYLMKKFKIKDNRKKKAEDIENISLMNEEIRQIPKPSCWNILPVQLVKLTIFIFTDGPSLVRETLASIKEEKERRQKIKEAEEEEEKRIEEEEEKRKGKKAARVGRKRVTHIPDHSSGGCVLDGIDGSDNDVPVVTLLRPASNVSPLITGGPWLEEDFVELSRLMAKYPGGTRERWEKIADTMGRTVYEVTRMSDKVKERMSMKPGELEALEAANEKQKPKTRGGKSGIENEGKISEGGGAGSDEMWTAVQQKSLEKAIKLNPKGTDQRWDKISKCVPDKTKEECMLRFKYLADMIKKKKQEEAEKLEKEEKQEVEENHKEEPKVIEESKVQTLEVTKKTGNRKSKKSKRKNKATPSESEEEYQVDDD